MERMKTSVRLKSSERSLHGMKTSVKQKSSERSLHGADEDLPNAGIM